MRRILLLAGAAALGVAGQAFAKPGDCPPRLAKNSVPCAPPGQAKKIYGVGERLPLGYGAPYAFNRIPPDLRARHGLPATGNYYYGDGYLYRVDPRTMLIKQSIAAALTR